MKSQNNWKEKNKKRTWKNATKEKNIKNEKHLKEINVGDEKLQEVYQIEKKNPQTKNGKKS